MSTEPETTTTEVENITLDPAREAAIPEFLKDKTLHYEGPRGGLVANPPVTEHPSPLAVAFMASCNLPAFGTGEGPSILNLLNTHLKKMTGCGITMDDIFGRASNGDRAIEHILHYAVYKDNRGTSGEMAELIKKIGMPEARHWRQTGRRLGEINPDRRNTRLPLFLLALDLIYYHDLLKEYDDQEFDPSLGFVQFFNPDLSPDAAKHILVSMYMALTQKATHLENVTRSRAEHSFKRITDIANSATEGDHTDNLQRIFHIARDFVEHANTQRALRARNASETFRDFIAQNSAVRGMLDLTSGNTTEAKPAPSL